MLAELEARVKKYEKWSHHDVDKLLLDIEKKDAELLALKAQVLLLVSEAFSY